MYKAIVMLLPYIRHELRNPVQNGQKLQHVFASIYIGCATCRIIPALGPKCLGLASDLNADTTLAVNACLERITATGRAEFNEAATQSLWFVGFTVTSASRGLLNGNDLLTIDRKPHLDYRPIGVVLNVFMHTSMNGFATEHRQ